MDGYGSTTTYDIPRLLLTKRSKQDDLSELFSMSKKYSQCTVLSSPRYCQRLATGRWFPVGSPDSSTNKTDRYDITEMLMKVALNTINQPTNQPTNQSANSTIIAMLPHNVACLIIFCLIVCIAIQIIYKISTLTSWY